METVETTKAKKIVTISDYMESRQYNKKLYARLVTKIESNTKQIVKEIPDLEISIGMSAKHQTPLITIKENDTIPQRIGYIEQEIVHALNEVGFSYTDSEDRETYYSIGFSD